MKIKVFAFVGFLGAAAFLAWEYAGVQRLRAENVRLASNQAEAAQLKSHLSVFESWQEVDGEISRLKKENHQLPGLRNEVRELREQQQELERLRAENARLLSLARQAGAPPPVLPAFLAGQPILTKESLTNAGFAIPEATAQTYFWAIREVNQEAWMNCLTPQLTQMVAGQQGTNSYFARALKQNANVTGYIIMKPGRTADSQDKQSSDHVFLTVYGLLDPAALAVAGSNGQTQQGRIGFGLRMAKLNGEWKVEK